MAGLPTETFGGHHHVLAYVYDPVTETNVPMTQPGAAVAGAGAAIYDGVSAAIAATVKDYTNSNPLTVILTDTNGDPYVAGGSSGLTDTQLRATPVPVSGTFYQATQPVSGTFYQATQPISAASLPSHDVTNAGTFAVQASGSVTANAGTNLNTALLGLESTQLLQATAANQATELASLSSIDTKLTNPLPVSLPAATVVTLTPPAAITGFALDSSLTTLNAKDFATAALQTSGNASLTAIYGVQPSTLVIDGQTVAYSADSTSRRLQEAQAIQGIITTINTIIGSECENSQRMGYELR